MNFGNDFYNLLLICVGGVFALTLFFLTILSLFKRKREKVIGVDKEFTDFLISKIDKIERALNDVKANMIRWQEFSELEFKEIEKGLNEVKKIEPGQFTDSYSVNDTFSDQNISQSIPSGITQEERKDCLDSESLDNSSSNQKLDAIDTVDTFELSENIKKKISKNLDKDVSASPVPFESDENETISFEDLSHSDINEETTRKKHIFLLRDNLSNTSSVSTGLRKTRESLFSKIKGIFLNKSILDSDAFDELEAILFSTDMGTTLTSKLIEELKAESSKGVKITEGELINRVKDKVREILINNDDDIFDEFNLNNAKPYVIMVVGVNGAGKTTTIAKLANTFKSQGKRVLIAAADTFRAAATEQLESWGKILNIPVVSGEEGVKPGTVAFDAMQRATKENFDILLIDTAGRLQSQANLMQELSGVSNLIKRLNSQAPHEVILVLDGTTGQNALLQAEKFKEVVPVTSVVITKLDGTPKGGIVVAIKSEFGIPIKFIGVGEGKDDLKVFDPDEFVEALFDVNN